MLLMGLQIRQSSPTTVLMGLNYFKVTVVQYMLDNYCKHFFNTGHPWNRG